MNWQGLKDNLKKALTFDGELKWWMMLVFYFIIIVPFYLFYLFAYKDFFTLLGQWNFVIQVAWLPLLFFGEFAILHYITYGQNPEGEYPGKKALKSFKEFIKECLKNNIFSFKIDLFQLVISLISYGLISYILYGLVEKAYGGSFLNFGIAYSVLLIIKFIVLISLLNLFTFSKSSNKMIFPIIGGVVFSDLWLILLHLLSKNPAELTIIKDKFLFLFGWLGSIDPTYVIGLFIGLFILINSRKSKILTDSNDESSLLTNIFIGIIISFMFALFPTLAMNSPKLDEFAVSPTKLVYLMKEFFIFLLAGFLLFRFLFNSFKIAKKNEGIIKKVQGEIIGYANHSSKKHITKTHSYDKIERFFILKSRSEEIILSNPKKNAFFTIKNRIYVGDKIESFGYYIKEKDLDKSNDEGIMVFIPLIIRIKKNSKLRKLSF